MAVNRMEGHSTIIMRERDTMPVSPPAPRTFDDYHQEEDYELHLNQIKDNHSYNTDCFLPPISSQLQSPRNAAIYFSPKKNSGGFLKSEKKGKSKLRSSMPSSMRITNTPDDQNPECIPFQPQNFMSSTKLKKIHIAKRHLDTFGGSEYSIPSKRGMILHTDRYSWEGARPIEGSPSVSQRDRLRLEIDYIEKLRGLKKMKGIWPHRMDIDLLMAGKSVEFEERFDLNGELQHLKSLVLPDTAKDLYHGKGIKLPSNHSSLKPRPRRMYHSLDDGGVSSSLRSLNPAFALDPEIRQGWPIMNSQGRTGLLPNIRDQKPNIRIGLGPTTDTPVSLSQARRATKGRKPSQPPSSILPQSTPCPLPRLELHGSRSLTTSNYPQQPIQRESSSKENSESALPLCSEEKEAETTTVPLSDGVVAHGNHNKITTNYSAESPRPDSAQQVNGTEDTHRQTENRLLVENENNDDDGNGEELKRGEETICKQRVNPLQGTHIERLISAGERTQLTQKFQNLDTDQVGHLQYEQLQSQLHVARNQELYLKQVYDVVSSQSIFGVDEFMTMSLLAKAIDQLSGSPADAFTTVDLETLSEPIIQYTELFESVDRSQNGHITVSSLREILSSFVGQELSTPTWNQILQNIAKEEEGRLSRIEFLTLIPYFQTLSDTHV